MIRKKQAYDQFGHAGFDQRYSQEDIFRNVNFEDIFGDLFGGSGGIFDSFFGGARRKRKGQDIQTEVFLDFEDVLEDQEKKIKLKKNVACDRCDGTGAEGRQLETCSFCSGRGMEVKQQRTPFGVFATQRPCHNCHGKGSMPKEYCKDCHGDGVRYKETSIDVKTPAGISDGQMLRVRGEGVAIKDGEPGDLIVYVNVRPHELFEREGNNIHIDLPVSFSQAALGDEVEVPTIKGKSTIKIPAGTQSSTTFRIKGKGIPDLNGYGKGDELVHVHVKTPQKLTKKAKGLLEELAKENKEKLKPQKGFFEGLFN